MITKDEAADQLITWHFEVEPELREVYRIMSGNEDDPSEPIKLLEINAATPPSGSVDAFSFAPTEEMPYRTVIAEITPEEFDLLTARKMRLPAGWSLEKTQIRKRAPAP